MIRKFISQVDGAEFQYRFNGINLELKADGCDWSDFIPEDKRAYSEPEYKELMTLLKVVRNEPRFWYQLQPLKCNPIEYSIIMSREKGLNIDVTRGQYMMLYNIMCEHNQMVNPEANPDFDLQTFDNLFQAITMAKETYL